MADRPTFIDFRSKSSDTVHSGVPVLPPALPSPKVTHMDGDIPPSMSPLDAFAAQSRMLAKKLDDSSRHGRRVSRLPPLTIADSLNSTRPGYFRSQTTEPNGNIDKTKLSPRNEESGNVPEVEQPAFRPKSFYPRMSGIALEEEEEDGSHESPNDQTFSTPAELGPSARNAPTKIDYFGGTRAQSPEPMQTARWKPDINDNAYQNSHQRSLDKIRGMQQPQRGQSTDSASVTSQMSNGLAPPQSPQHRHAASIRSVPVDSSDDELSASTNGSSFSIHRKQSSSSGVSVPRSPLSPWVQTHGRSPSLNSEYSAGGSRLARPTYNFSRPISRGSMGRTSLEAGSRQPSFDTRPSFDTYHRQPSSGSQGFIFTDETVQTPMSIKSEHFADAKAHPDAPAPSYIYAKFSLPRGRMLERDSEPFDMIQMPHFEPEQPMQKSNVHPVTPPASDHNRSASPALSYTQSPKPSVEVSRSSPRPSGEHHQQPPRPPPTPLNSDNHSQSSASMRSGSTIKARSYSRSATVNTRDSRELTAEDHLNKGIESHEQGNYKESTYHLRIAARQNLSTAMLLYALACRHGWGMRPNQQEGVQWLRRAADSASLELADDESKQLKPEELQKQKARRTQFALSIYELGVSHMNGWGIEQDKALALRCFEIAGNWGDADALAEAGFCYAQGTGCKKDLKKAARYYRMAEAKGMSMVGNSWYVLTHSSI